MPSEAGPDAPAAGLQILVAPFLDFQFVLFVLSKREVQPGKPTPEWLIAWSREHEPLFRRAVDFWPNAGVGSLEDGTPYTEWGELMVLAWRAGMLFSPDVRAAIDAAGRAAATPFETPELPSEQPNVSRAINRRLKYLAENPQARAEYVALQHEMWTAIEPQWLAEGEREARETAAQLELRARSEPDLRKLVTTNSFVHKDQHQPQITAARNRGELYLVPLALGDEGAVYWALPGAVIVGVGSGTPRKQARKRARMEDAAGRFKVVSDPTRLAILNEVMHAGHYNASTVTELASLFALSQPTVSVHMKILREAGLVDTERDGNRVMYRADEAAVRKYIQEAMAEALNSSGPNADADC